jgi:hypothetical protein
VLNALSCQSRQPDLTIICVPEDSDVQGLNRTSGQELIIGSRGLTRQRNAILERVEEFDIIVFFDDFLPATPHLARIERVFARYPEVVMATGRVLADGIIGPGLSLDEARRLLSAAVADDFEAISIEDVANAYGCNMAIRCATVSTSQCRFDERPRAGRP